MHLPLLVQTCAQRSASLVPAPPASRSSVPSTMLDRVWPGRARQARPSDRPRRISRSGCTRRASRRPCRAAPPQRKARVRPPLSSVTYRPAEKRQLTVIENAAARQFPSRRRASGRRGERLQFDVRGFEFYPGLRAISHRKLEQARRFGFRPAEQSYLCGVEIYLATWPRRVVGSAWSAAASVASVVSSPRNNLMIGAGHAPLSTLAVAFAIWLGSRLRCPRISSHNAE